MTTITSEFQPDKPQFNVDDVVRVRGYGDAEFTILSVNYDYYRDKGVEYGDIFYEAQRIDKPEIIELIGEEDALLVRSSGNKPERGRKEERSIDDLLDELSDYLALQERFGEHEDDERRDMRYSLRICELKAQIIEAQRRAKA